MHRDEALAVMVARRPLGELLETVQLVRGGAPLHFLLAKVVAEFGGGLVATRAISALGLLLAIVAVGLLGRALAGPVVGAAAAWIVALSPVALYYGDFARMYSLFLAFSALALWCLVRALDTDEPRYWAGTAALLVARHLHAPLRRRRRPDRRARGARRAAAGARARGLAPAAVRRRGRDRRHRAARRSATSCWPRGSTRCRSRRATAIPKPSLPDVAAQAGAHFVGVPRSGGLIALYLVVCAALALVGLVTIARGGGGRARARRRRGSSCPLLVLAVVRIPNSDNHVRYVIETLPLAGIAIAYGAATLGRLLGLARRDRGGAGRRRRSSARSRRRAARASPTTASAATRGRCDKADLDARGGLPAHEFRAQRPLPRLRRGLRGRRALAGRQRRRSPRRAARRAPSRR